VLHSSSCSDVQSGSLIPRQIRGTSSSCGAPDGLHSGDTQHFAVALRSSGEDADDGWRRWARRLLSGDDLDSALLARVWAEVVSFDEKLAAFLASPVPVPDGTIIVSGSGKEWTTAWHAADQVAQAIATRV
jgi:anthranilate phosphoribosyltransferase